MAVTLRHLVIAFLPLLFGLGAGWSFAYMQESCTRLVGFLFSAKCRGVQLEYQVVFQTWGTAAGCLVAAVLGAWLERRREHARHGTVKDDVANVEGER
jgi:membrane associated rhomboid family serine protease